MSTIHQALERVAHLRTGAQLTAEDRGAIEQVLHDRADLAAGLHQARNDAMRVAAVKAAMGDHLAQLQNELQRLTGGLW